MKKYLFVGCIVALLFAAIKVYAAVCQSAPTCASMNYTLTSSQVASLGSNYSCTACPLDGSKWSCAARSSSGGGSTPTPDPDPTPTPDPVDPTPTESCPDGFTTTITSGSYCIEELTHDEMSPTPGVSGVNHGWVTITPTHKYACDDYDFLQQYHEDPSEDCPLYWGMRTTKNAYKYLCKNGTANGKPCLSIIHHVYYEFTDGTSTPEPCSFLYGAEPDPACGFSF